MIASQGIEIAAVPSVPAQSSMHGMMRGPIQSAGPLQVPPVTAPAASPGFSSEWQTLLASLGMIGGATAHPDATTDLGSVSASTAQKPLEAPTSGKNENRPGAATGAASQWFRGPATPKPSETPQSASVGLPDAASEKALVPAFAQAAGSAEEKRTARTGTTEAAQESRAAEPRNEEKKALPIAGDFQVETAVLGVPVPQESVQFVPIRSGPATRSTPDSPPLATDAAESTSTAAAIPLQHHGSPVAMQRAVDAEKGEGSGDAAALEAKSNLGPLQIQAVAKDTAPGMTAFRREPEGVSPISDAPHPRDAAQAVIPRNPESEAWFQTPVRTTGEASASTTMRLEPAGSRRAVAAQATHAMAVSSAPPGNPVFSTELPQNLSAAHPGAAAVGSSTPLPAPVQPIGAASTGKEPFAAMDSGSGAVIPTWIHTGARQVEAGFQDPSLGWVGVRAQVDGGAIHAALVPGSADAAQSLVGHLAGLNAYLADHHTPVESLTLASPESHWPGQGMDPGTGQHSGQGMSHGESSGQRPGHPTAAFVPVADSLNPVMTTAGVDVSSLEAPPGGVYISVMA